MRYLYFSISILVLSLSLGLTSAHAMPPDVLFMKANSTAKLYTELTFSQVSGSWDPRPVVFSYPSVNDNYMNSDSITIRAEPNSFDVTQSNVDVTYTIITKNDTKGTFEIFTGSWGYSYPLVVGLNESEVNPKVFDNFRPISCTYCPSFSTNPPSEKVIGYSGIIPKTISEITSEWTDAQKTKADEEQNNKILLISTVGVSAFAVTGIVLFLTRKRDNKIIST